MAGVLAGVLALLAVWAPFAVAAASGSPRRCAPVAYSVDAGFGPPGGVALVSAAFREAEALTGLRFVRVGPGDLADGVPVRVAWTAAGAPPWGASELGLAWAEWAPRDGFTTLAAGQVLLRSPGEADRVHGGPVDWYVVVRHEIGHLLGLPHRADPTAVMHPRLDGRTHAWTTEDLLALAERGRVSGCPPPGPSPWAPNYTRPTAALGARSPHGEVPESG